jgi:hypothetical protein
MKSRLLTLILSLIMALLAACDKSTDASNSPSNAASVEARPGLVRAGADTTFLIVGGKLQTFLLIQKANTTYQIQSVGAMLTRLELKDTCGNYLAQDDHTNGNNGNISWYADSSTPVLIVVHGDATVASGSVTLKISKICEPDSFESDNTLHTARELKADGLAQVHSLTKGDVDFVKIAVVAGRTYHMSASRFFQVFSADSSALDNGGGQMQGSFSYTAPTNGFIYACIVLESSESLGTYSIRASSELNGRDLYEPDDSSATATEVKIDSVEQIHFLPSGDVDWVKFSLTAGVKYQVIIGGNDSTSIQSELFYPDMSSSWSWPFYGGAGTNTIMPPVSGTYFLKFSLAGSLLTGKTYSIRVIQQ